MIEVPQDQLTTVFELAQAAAGMARSAFSTSPPGSPDQGEQTDVMIAASPLAAEIFKTLVRCHVVNKSNRLAEEAKNLFRSGDEAMGRPSTYPGSPASYGGGRI